MDFYSFSVESLLIQLALVQAILGNRFCPVKPSNTQLPPPA